MTTTNQSKSREMTWTAYVSWPLVEQWEAIGWRRDEGILQGCIHAEFGCYMVWDSEDEPIDGPRP